MRIRYGFLGDGMTTKIIEEILPTMCWVSSVVLAESPDARPCWWKVEWCTEKLDACLKCKLAPADDVV